MGWLSLFTGLIKAASLIATMMREKGLMDGAVAKAAVASLGETSEQVSKAVAARRAANRANADPNELRKPDDHQRD